MSQWLQFLVVLALAVLACIKVTLQSSMSRHHIHVPQDSVWFNVLLFSSIAICLCILFPLGTPDMTVFALAALSGIGMATFQSCYAIALNVGPVSLTVLISNFSVLFITLFGILAFGDKMYASQLLGVALLVVSMFLSVKSDSGEQKKATRSWLLLTLTSLFTNGACSCIQRVYMATESGAGANMDVTFLVVMYVFSGLAALAMYLFTAVRRKHSAHPEGAVSTIGFNPRVLLYAALIALVLSVYQKTYMFSITNIEGTFLFPTYAGLQALGMTLIGMLFFRDRLTPRQRWGLVCGILCVVLMNVKVGPSF